MSDLLERQFAFAERVPKLIDYIFLRGFKCTLGEVFRDPRWAVQLAKLKKGIPNSLHISKLAIDILLFKDGAYLTDVEPYRQFGEYWKSLSTPQYECSWGGDFVGTTAGDAGHFSIQYQGRK